MIININYYLRFIRIFPKVSYLFSTSWSSFSKVKYTKKETAPMFPVKCQIYLLMPNKLGLPDALVWQNSGNTNEHKAPVARWHTNLENENQYLWSPKNKSNKYENREIYWRTVNAIYELDTLMIAFAVNMLTVQREFRRTKSWHLCRFDLNNFTLMLHKKS